MKLIRKNCHFLGPRSNIYKWFIDYVKALNCYYSYECSCYKILCYLMQNYWGFISFAVARFRVGRLIPHQLGKYILNTIILQFYFLFWATNILVKKIVGIFSMPTFLTCLWQKIFSTEMMHFCDIFIKTFSA